MSKKTIEMARAILRLWLLLGFIFSMNAFAGPVGDRVVLRLGQTAFTQRQLEMHVAIKSQLDDNWIQISAQNYLENLELFRRNMLILLEVLRLDRSYPAKNRLIAAFSQIQQAKKRTPAFSALIDRLQIDDLAIQNEIVNVFQIMDFKSLKEKSRQKQWFSELEERYDQGFLQNDANYIEIHPKG